MPARAGQIVVELTAGSRTFIQDVEIAKTKLREFGVAGQSANAGMVSGTKATAASLKALEGQFANNNRAATAFITTILGGGKIMQAAFPIVGGLAFAGMLETVGTKIVDYFKKLEEAPARTEAAFRGIYEPLQKENDELQVTNDKLAMEIGKLGGHPGNGLQLALHEAWVVADKLETAVSKTLKDLAEVQKKEGIGALSAFLTGRASTKGDESEIKGFQDLMARIDAEGQANVRAAKSKEDARKAQDAWNKKALDALDQEIERYRVLTEQSRKLQEQHDHPKPNPAMFAGDPTMAAGAMGGEAVPIPDQSVLLSERQGIRDTLQSLRDRYALSADEATMQGELPGLRAAEDARKQAEAAERAEREKENQRVKAEQEDWNRLIEQRSKFKEQFLTGIDVSPDIKHQRFSRF